MKFRKAISAMAATAVSFSALSAFAFQASAADDMTITVDSITAAAGETFEVNVNLANVPADGVSGIEFAVKYDSSLITVTDVTEGAASKTGATDAELDKNGDLADSAVNGSYSALSYNINTKNSTVDLIWMTGLDNSYYIKNDGVLVTISGTVNPDASGKAELEIVPISRTDISGNNSSIYASVGDEATLVTPVLTNGNITISSEAEITTSDEPSETTTNSWPAAKLLGDATCDDVVDIRDVTVLNQFIVKTTKLTEQGLANADVVADGDVGIKDLGQLKKFIIKVITKF